MNKEYVYYHEKEQQKFQNEHIAFHFPYKVHTRASQRLL